MNRESCVEAEKKVSVALMHGFCLGSVLFNIFTNNLHKRVNCMLIKFTDDTNWRGVTNTGWPDF